jgi:hypothetical protein
VLGKEVVDSEAFLYDNFIPSFMHTPYDLYLKGWQRPLIYPSKTSTLLPKLLKAMGNTADVTGSKPIAL